MVDRIERIITKIKRVWDMVDRIKRIITKIKRIWNMVEIKEDGDIKIKVEGILIVEAGYVLISTERKGDEMLKKVKEIEKYDDTKDGVMYGESSNEISTNKETRGSITRYK